MRTMFMFILSLSTDYTVFYYNIFLPTIFVILDSNVSLVSYY
jgi:hypothetical protein